MCQASQVAAGVALVAGDFNIIAHDDFRYQHRAMAVQAGDGWASEALQSALSDMTEMHQEAWTFRRFERGCLATASRIDRANISLRPDVLHRFVVSVVAAGSVLERNIASDHLPLTVSFRKRRKRDPRVAPHVDRRVFDDPHLYADILSRSSVSSGLGVQDAFDQLQAFKSVARAVARERELCIFRVGEPSPRDQARLAMRALRLWHAHRKHDVRKVCDAWPALAAHFEDGELRSEEAYRRWVADLVEGEALATLHEIGQSGAPDAGKQQARDRVQARVAQWRVRMP